MDEPPYSEYHRYTQTIMRRVWKEKNITCRLIGKFFMLIMAKLPSTLILYL